MGGNQGWFCNETNTASRFGLQEASQLAGGHHAFQENPPPDHLSFIRDQLFSVMPHRKLPLLRAVSV